MLASWLWGFVGGFIAWFVTTFVAGPILRFDSLKERIAATIYFYDDLGASSDRATEAREKIRTLAADLKALAGTAPALQILRWCGYEPGKAADALFGFSNCLKDKSGEKAKHRTDVERALKLPLSFPNM